MLFWERRIRRILPALVVVIFATIVTGWFLFLPHDFKMLGESVVAQATLLSNVFFWQQSGYFAPGNDTEPLLHTWSLAVEEQFYLLFPLFLIVLAKCRKLSLTKIIICLAVGSLALSVFGSYSHPSATFYLLPTRAWELMIGALLATTRGSFSGVGRLWREVSGWLGIGLIVFSIFFYDNDTRFPGAAAIPPCFGAAMIIFSSESNLSFVGGMLAFKPVAFVGLISYSLYLWHWPLLVFAKYQLMALQWQSVVLRTSLLLVSFMLACLSWRYVETPFRKRLIFHQRSKIFGFASVSMTILLVLGLIVYRNQGFPSRLPAKALSYFDSRNNKVFFNNLSLEDAMNGDFAELGSKETNQPINLLIWGDSHAMSVTSVLDDLCRQFSWRGAQATHALTAPILGYVSTSPYSLKGGSLAFNKAVISFIAKNHIKNIVIAASWSSYPASDSFKTNLLLTVRTVMNLGAKVYVLKDVPIQSFDSPRFAAITAMHHGDIEKLGLTREAHQMANHELDGTFEQISKMGAIVLDPAPYFLNSDGLYGIVKNDKLLYRDGNHLTVAGAKLLSPMFEPIFHTN